MWCGPMSHPESTKYTIDTYRTKFGEREFVTCIKQEQIPSSAFADTQVIYEVVRGVCEGGVCEGRYVRDVCGGGMCGGGSVRGECVRGVCVRGRVWRWKCEGECVGVG